MWGYSACTLCCSFFKLLTVTGSLVAVLFLEAVFFLVTVFFVEVVRLWVDVFFACWATAGEENAMSATSTIVQHLILKTLLIIEP